MVLYAVLHDSPQPGWPEEPPVDTANDFRRQIPSVLHENRKTTRRGEILNSIYNQAIADLLIQQGVSTGPEKAGHERDNFSDFAGAGVSSYSAETRAEPWDIQGRVFTVERVCLVRMA